jgi:large subunit ribosomal protein L32e
MAPTPLRKIKKTVKRAKRFTKHEFEDYPGKLTSAWRRPRGIDSRVRRQFRGNKPLVKIGYGNKRDQRHILPSGFKKFLVRTPSDLEMLLMNNRVFAAEIATNLSARKREQVVQRARELNVKVLNPSKKNVEEKKQEN